MKYLQSYKAFTFAQVTEHDVQSTGGIDSRYMVGEILVFRPGESRQLGYEDTDAGSIQEAKDFVDSDEEIIKKHRTKDTDRER